jgi:hypothetical protein
MNPTLSIGPLDRRVAPEGHILPATMGAERDDPAVGLGLAPGRHAPGEEHSAAERLWFDDTAHHTSAGHRALPGPSFSDNSHAPGPAVSNAPASNASNDNVAGTSPGSTRARIDAFFTPPPLPEVDLADQSAPRARVLVRVCDSLFQRLGKLNRQRRTGFPDGRPRPQDLRVELEQSLERVLASTVPRDFSKQLADLELPLRCFVDLVMTRGGFGFQEIWEPLAPEAAGTPQLPLIDAAAEALADPAPDALEQLEVLQVCLSFSAHLIEPTPVQRPVAPLLQRISERLSPAGEPLFTPTAYDGVFTRAILTPVSRRLRLLAGVSIALLLLAVAGAVALNWYYCRQLDGSINTVRAALERSAASSGR